MNGFRLLREGIAGVALAVAALGTSPQMVEAQAAPGWSAWLGCWEPVPAEGAAVPAVTPYLCFVPGESATQVDVVTVEAGEVGDRHTLDASGAAVTLTREECSGTETMQWSADANRIYQQSAYECPGGLQRTSSGVLSMTASGEWLDVAAVSAGEATSVRVIRYRPALEAEARVQEIADALDGRAMTRELARHAAMAPIDRADVVEALSHIDAPAVEGWLIESGQNFQLARESIIELADAGVPDRVIDVMVALSYPQVFAIDRAGRPEELPAQAGGPAVGSLGMRDPWLNPYGYWSLYNNFYPGYFYSDYYYDPYYYPGSGYRRGYGYGGYGPGYNRPIIIVVPDDGSEPGAEGRAVNNRGYTRGGNGSSEPRSTGPSRSTGNSGGSGSGSSATSDGYSGGSSGGSGSGDSTGRTARPR